VGCDGRMESGIPEQDRIALTANFEHVELEHLCPLIADMLLRLMEHNDKIPLSPEILTRFHSRTSPNISVLDYLRRIVQYTKVERSCLLITLHYIDQLCARNPRFTITSLTCHRFIITSIAISSKTFCDSFCTNNLYAKVGGISVAELNILEREFLRMIDWRLTCTPELLQEYYANLVRTYSTGRFIITGTQSSNSVSSDSDIEVDASSRPVSPVTTTEDPIDNVSHFMGISMPNRIPGDLAPPSIEQNMAFADLQQQSQDNLQQ